MVGFYGEPQNKRNKKKEKQEKSIMTAFKHTLPAELIKHVTAICGRGLGPRWAVEIREWAFAYMVIGAWWTFDEMPEHYDNNFAEIDIWDV